MSEYTPTTEQVRRGFAEYRVPFHKGWFESRAAELEVGEAEFDRWLAEHDREVAAKALRDAAGGMRRWKQAGTWYLPDSREPGDVSYSPDRWLEVWADRIEKGEEQ